MVARARSVTFNANSARRVTAVPRRHLTNLGRHLTNLDSRVVKVLALRASPRCVGQPASPEWSLRRASSGGAVRGKGRAVRKRLITFGLALFALVPSSRATRSPSARARLPPDRIQ
jgi:hypothetical protein